MMNAEDAYNYAMQKSIFYRDTEEYFKAMVKRAINDVPPRFSTVVSGLQTEEVDKAVAEFKKNGFKVMPLGMENLGGLHWTSECPGELSGPGYQYRISWEDPTGKDEENE